MDRVIKRDGVVCEVKRAHRDKVVKNKLRFILIEM